MSSSCPSPKPSPKQSPRPSPKNSPKRRPPLHERTNSQTNEIASPSLRLVEGAESRIYSQSPYPTKPAHILSPHSGQGLVFEGQNRVSDNVAPDSATASPELVGDRNGKSRRLGHALDISSIPQDTEQAHAVTSRSEWSHTYNPAASRKLHDVLEESGTSSPRPSDEVIVLPNVGLPDASIKPVDGTPEHSPETTSRFNDLSSSPNFVTINRSSSSLTSSNSRGTVKRHSGRGGHWTLSTFPANERPTSSTSDLSSSRPLNTVPEDSARSSSPPISSSGIYSSSPTSSNIASSSPNFTVHYPVVRPASSSSGSWAESSIVVPKQSSRMTDLETPKWNPHLSTVPSEWSQEKRHERSQGSRTDPSSLAVEEPSQPSTPQVPKSLFSDGKRRDGSGVRIVDDAEMAERGDSVMDLRAPQLKAKNSGFLSLWSSDSRRTSVTSGPERPGSSRSLRSNIIPAWARAYYSRPAGESLGAPSSSVSRASSFRRHSLSPAMDHFPLSIFQARRPKTPGGGRPLPPRPDSLATDPNGEAVVHEAQGVPVVHRPVQGYTRPPWSPRLYHDRRSVNPRRSFWRAPSLDEKAEGLFTRRNAQVGLFAVGFVFPLAWLIASFLPLPPKPVQSGDKGAQRSGTDVEQAFDHRIGPIDEVRYENARWWRVMNRAMAVVGVVIVVTVITLAVVAAR